MLDASLVLAWCFEDEKTLYSEKILDLMSEEGEALVPSLWPIEVINALLMAQRKKRITEAQITRFLTRLYGLNISVVPIDIAHTFEQTLLQAQAWKLTAYDSVYLELALRKGLPLATLDVALQKAARNVGVPLAT